MIPALTKGPEVTLKSLSSSPTEMCIRALDMAYEYIELSGKIADENSLQGWRMKQAVVALNSIISLKISLKGEKGQLAEPIKESRQPT